MAGVDLERSAKPVKIDELAAVQIEVAGHYACAFEPLGRVWCWGQYGTGATSSGLVQVRVASNNDDDEDLRIQSLAMAKAASGLQVSCAATVEGDVVCWGDVTFGVSDVVFPDRAIRIGVSDVVDVSVGRNAACAVDRAGTIWCWGRENFGAAQLTELMVAVPVESDVCFEQVHVGDNHICAVSRGGQVYCWGNDEQGQLAGAEVHADPLTPGLVPAL